MRNLCFFCILLLFYQSKAQTPNDFAESFFYFPRNVFSLLPSHVCIQNDMQASLIYKSYTGQLSSIRTYMADVNFNVQKRDAAFPQKTKHILGGGFYNAREGEHFNRNRAYVRYAWHTQLTDELFLAAGTSIYVVNYFFKSSSAGSTGSDFAWSGSFGSSLYSRFFKLGIALNEFNNPKLTPVNYTFVLARFVTMHLEKSFETSYETRLTTSVRANLVPQGYSTYMAQAGMTFAEKVGINGFAHNTQGWGLAVELDRVELGKSLLDLCFAYKVPYANGYPPVNQYELNLIYYFERAE